jgi:hypothetical protein
MPSTSAVVAMIAFRHRSSERGTARRILSSAGQRGADHDDLGRAETNPVHPISSATLFSKIMIAKAGRNAVKSSNQFSARARSGAKPYRIVTTINKISSGASRLIRYQRNGTRHRKLRPARSRTPAFPLTRAATINAGIADPRTFASTPCGVAPPGRNPGSVSP